MTYLLIAAILLDECFAEVKRFHPLVGFGHYALFLERHLYTKEAKNAFWQGVLCWCLAILPILLISILGMKLLADYGPSWLYYLLSVIILYFTIGQKSLKQHGQAVMQPLLAALNNKNNADKSKDIKEARYALSMIVSRDTQDASPHQIANATIETMTENTHDAVIGPMLFFIAFGAPGAILFRLVNTLDAMWGYRTTRYEYFGKFSARADDVLGFVPARVTAPLY